MPLPTLPFLDLVRFAAALLVLFGHARGMVLEEMGRVEQPTLVTKAVYLVTGLQHEGVVLFFVVSGFLVGGSAWRLLERQEFDLKTYLVNRFTRIYLVYVPALVLVGLLATNGAYYFADTRFYGERPLMPSGMSAGLSVWQVPCHLAGVQRVLCREWGADPALWSLGYEWTIYLIAPALFGLVAAPMDRVARRRRLVAVAALFAGLTWLDQEWYVWFLIWLLGAASMRFFMRGTVGARTGAAGLLVCVAALVLSRTRVMPPLATDALIALGLVVALACPGVMSIDFARPVIRRGAGFSYSLYLIHMPVCVFAGALLERLFQWPHTVIQPGPVGYAGFAFLVTSSLGAALLFAMITEDRTAAVRRKLSALLDVLPRDRRIVAPE